ncbi:MAG: sodium:calcium antiporter [Solirubrobacteraceae bacterium]
MLAGLYVLEEAAEHFTAAVGALARRLRASEGIVGLLTAGGEWEELVVVLIAVLGGHPGVAAGNVIGACLANLIGSMPLGLLGRRPLEPDRSARVYGVVLVAVTVLAAAVASSGRVSQPAGGLLIGVFGVYVASVVVIIRRGWLRAPSDDDEDEDDVAAEGVPPARRSVLVLALSLIVISGAAEAIVLGASHIAHQIGLSEYAIGATVVAVGTTLPDKAISLIGGVQGQGGVVTANALGSNIFVLTLVLGVAAIFSGGGLHIGAGIVSVDFPLLLGATLLVVALFFRRRLHRATGIALLALYVGYLALALLRG